MRSLGLLIAVLSMLLTAVSRAEPANPSPSATAQVRTGVAEPPPEEPPPKHAEPHQLPPGDAPTLGADALKIPEPPASFNVHPAGWISFAYLPSVRERVQPIITRADAMRAELSGRLGVPVLRRVTVYVARTPGEMATLAPEGAPVPKYAAGVAYPQLGLVLLTIQPIHPNSHHDLGEVFQHELAHLALYDAVGGKHVPRWFNEGFAVYASGESSFARMQALWTATLSDNLLPLKRMERTFPSDDVGVSVAYAQAADVVRFLVRQQDLHRFRSMIERVRGGEEFEAALENAYRMDVATLEYEWREDAAKRYTFWPVFFSSTVVWFGALGLFVWGWRRRKQRNKETLERWAREEAVEEQRRRELEAPRVHIVLARATQRMPDLKPPMPSEPEIPKVEHEGRWHTLH